MYHSFTTATETVNGDSAIIGICVSIPTGGQHASKLMIGKVKDGKLDRNANGQPYQLTSYRQAMSDVLPTSEPDEEQLAQLAENVAKVTESIDIIGYDSDRATQSAQLSPDGFRIDFETKDDKSPRSVSIEVAMPDLINAIKAMQSYDSFDAIDSAVKALGLSKSSARKTVAKQSIGIGF